MDKYLECMRKLALFSEDDSFVSIPKVEYESLLRESETLRIITDLLKKDAFFPTDTVKTILNIDVAEGVATTFFNKEAPKEGK